MSEPKGEVPSAMKRKLALIRPSSSGGAIVWRLVITLMLHSWPPADIKNAAAMSRGTATTLPCGASGIGQRGEGEQRQAAEMAPETPTRR